VKRIPWVALGVVALLAGLYTPASAQDEAGLTLSFSAGFDGYCRSDSWCPVYVVVSNEGADVEGELQASLDGDVGFGVYVKRVTLPAHSCKAYFFYLPIYALSSRPKIAVRLMVGKEEAASKSLTAALLENGERLFGVVSRNPSELNFLSTVAPAGGKAAVAQLDLESLPPDPLAWEGLDVLVLNDVDTTALSGEQKQALETWVAHGGHLVVGGGAGAALTVAGLGDLLPVSVGGTRSVDTLWALGEFVGAPVAAGPYAIAEVTLRDGKALVEQDGSVLVARRAYGRGGVNFLAFNAGVNPFVDWDDNTRLWQRVVGEPVGQQQLSIRNGYQAREAVNTIPGVSLPSILQILAFLLVYTILIGPVNYIVLRRLDRRELAWITIPALILGFSACAYVTGFQLRGFNAIVHRLAVVYVPQDSQVGRVSQLVGLFSPQRSSYDVRLPGMEARNLPETFYYGEPSSRPLRVLEDAEGITVTDLRVNVGGIEPFVAEGYADVPGIDANLRLSESGSSLYLEGTIRTGVALENAVLLTGGPVEHLGDLAAGEEVTVRTLFHGGTTIATGLSEQILGTSDYWSDSLLYRRYQFMEGIFSPYYNPYWGGSPSGVSLRGVYLIGWSDEDVPLSVEVVGRSYSAVETALYVYELPVAGPEDSTKAVVPLGLVRLAIREGDAVGYVEERSDGLYIGFESELTLRFVPSLSNVIVDKANELVLDMQSSYDYATPPVVSAWDWKGGDWRRLDVGWGQHSIPDVQRYVSPSGSVLLHLKAATEVTLKRLALTIER
jgi:hypothetical protein